MPQTIFRNQMLPEIQCTSQKNNEAYLEINRNVCHCRVLRSNNPPLIRSIREYQLQATTNPPDMSKYDGSSDLDDHIEN